MYKSVRIARKLTYLERFLREMEKCYRIFETKEKENVEEVFLISPLKRVILHYDPHTRNVSYKNIIIGFDNTTY